MKQGLVSRPERENEEPLCVVCVCSPARATRAEEPLLLSAPRSWIVDGRPAGLVKSASPLELALVKDSGHMVPMNQPEVALEMITRFINAIPLTHTPHRPAPTQRRSE